jgi:hypothetical protein
VCRDTRVWKYGGIGAWLRTKFDGELNIKEKIKRIMGWRGVGSRIQVKATVNHDTTACAFPALTSDFLGNSDSLIVFT